MSLPASAKRTKKSLSVELLKSLNLPSLIYLAKAQH